MLYCGVRPLGSLRNRLRQIVDRQLEAAPEIDRAADGCRRCSSQDDAPRGVRHVGEIARLRAVAEDDHRFAGETAQEKLRNDFAAVSLMMASRSVSVERTNDDRGIRVGAMKRPRVSLAG